MSDAQRVRLMRKFAIRFIFESNAIEGSRLEESEVAAIVEKKYVKKSIAYSEVAEVENSIECFNYISSDSFSLNHKSIIRLHKILVADLGIQQGFKKHKIIVNNKETADPKEVRAELTALITWYKKEKKNLHPFERAVIFHNRFERIHPFEDGNGRVCRLILNWMLMQAGYGYILVQNKNKTAYINALSKGDETSYRNLLLFCSRTYSQTMDMLIDASV